MKKPGFITFIIVFVTCATHAQGPDKEKITDLFQNQQYEDAIDYLKPFYSKDSGNLQILNSLGYALYMNDNRDEAKIYFHKIFDIDSNNISANQYLANIDISNRDYDLAKTFVVPVNSYQSLQVILLQNTGRHFQEKQGGRFRPFLL